MLATLAAMRLSERDASGQAQPGQQVQRIDVFGWAELRADEMQVARRGSNVAVSEQLLDSQEIYPAFEQMGGTAVARVGRHVEPTRCSRVARPLALQNNQLRCRKLRT